MQVPIQADLRNIVFFFFVVRWTRKTFWKLKGRGLIGSVVEFYSTLRRVLYGYFLRAPGVRGQVQKQVNESLSKLQGKMVPTNLTRYLTLPKEGLSDDVIRTELDTLANMDHTRWEDGYIDAFGIPGTDLITPDKMQNFYAKYRIENEEFPLQVCSLCAAVQGMDETTVNGAQVFYKEAFGIANKDKLRDALILGLTNGAPYLCCALLGCWLTAPLNNWFGRRGTIFLSCLISAAACMGQALTNDWKTMFAVLMPLVQGVVYNLFLLGWQSWNRNAQIHGSSVGARVRRSSELASAS
ncbi:Sphingosine-1-phosphate lyase like protein [Verticillium longisporum]|nr:Sphingosine-1-phosphate lyase like protein [Verticillium longisporum]